MASEISWELREEAEELYIVDGLTYDQTAARTGIAVQTLKKWGAAEGWTEKRRMYRDDRGEIRRNTVQLRKKLIAKALKSLDPQDVYAATRMEALADKRKPNIEPQPVTSKRSITSPSEAIDALQEAVERHVNLMFQQPDSITPQALRDLHKSFELIEEMKKRYCPTDMRAKSGGISDEFAEELRRKVLGIVNA